MNKKEQATFDAERDQYIKAFVDGVRWWEYEREGATLWQYDRDLAEKAAARKFDSLALMKDKPK